MYPKDTWIQYPEPGKRTLPKLKQPRPIHEVLKSAVNIYKGMIIFQGAFLTTMGHNAMAIHCLRAAAGEKKTPTIIDRMTIDQPYCKLLQDAVSCYCSSMMLLRADT